MHEDLIFMSTREFNELEIISCYLSVYKQLANFIDMKIISGILVLTVYLNIKHGWNGLTNRVSPEEAKQFADLGINRTNGLIIGVATLTVVPLILFPLTFFAGNLLNAVLILFIIAMASKQEI